MSRQIGEAVLVDDLLPGDEINDGGPVRWFVDYVHPLIDTRHTLHLRDGANLLRRDTVGPAEAFLLVSTVQSRRAQEFPYAAPIVGRAWVTLYGSAREDRQRVQSFAEASFAGLPDCTRLEVTERYEVPADTERGFGEATRWEITAYGPAVAAPAVQL